MHSLSTVIVLSQDKAVIQKLKIGLEEAESHRVFFCESTKHLIQRINEIDVDILFYDIDFLSLKEKNILSDIRVSHQYLSQIIICSFENRHKAEKMAHFAAAYLYINKPISSRQIAWLTKRALELKELSRRHRLISRELKISIDDSIFNDVSKYQIKGGYSQFERMVYVSDKIAQLIIETKLAAQTNLPILIEGETGTGKELLARAIHFNSKQKNELIHVQNCGGLSDSSLHSELFGHVCGAFPGAISDRLGLFRAADNGTVFLDEISEVSQSFQVSLLRFLQEGEVKPLGSDEMHHANVRIIVASNKSLKQLVTENKFRRDLYYRIKGFELKIPPLRERREDIPILVDFFIEKYAGIVGRRVVGLTPDALSKLQNYDYPGNVRELETEIRRMIAVAEDGGYISTRHLSDVFDKVSINSPSVNEFSIQGKTLKEMVDELECNVIQQTLSANQWNQSKTANDLGLSRVGLANKIKRFELRDQHD